MTVGSVGSNCEKDMMWNRFSVLQKYANSKGVLRDVFTNTLRKAADSADFHKLDEISETISLVGKKYGVELSSDVKSKLLIQNNILASSVGLFEDGAPLSQRGLGSQRLLSMGLNINATSEGTLLLIDEIEAGLEPYRLRSLINEFRSKSIPSGQIIMTTHSPVVVAECTNSELLIIQSKNGVTTSFSLHNIEGQTNDVIQKEVRRNPEAFLCKRIIVCEGKTEIGFVRALDDYVSSKYYYRMACEGVGTALGGGTELFNFATFLAKCGYGVCILMDSDLDGIDDLKRMAKETHNIDIFDWDKGNSIEEQIFFDVSELLVEELLQIAVNSKGIDSISSKLTELPICIEDDKVRILEISAEQKRMIGTISKQKKSEWYKRIDLGEQMGEKIFVNWDSISDKTTLYRTITNLVDWVKNND
ncbi:MAG TPA: hypothetical protein DCW42_01645 [Bacteroidetes bacterium]|nr:hypothetical protein [Bacteroidota bacterium]